VTAVPQASSDSDGQIHARLGGRRVGRSSRRRYAEVGSIAELSRREPQK